ncbi:mannitol dehydrogenase family protein [Rhodobacteraceae bacterium 2CG4]|uniref:Mannitol dehydrogenase family protein n=1 Tax=Halovulum marinum TaxID=2662447 RepID=A0A6L5Z3R1_9RHOB|nr:mannitol dehydrogenase family protein [Halovulum marinum]MSU90720.1 mannitol dehydrogenase family protein [Halovulum marinum]
MTGRLTAATQLPDGVAGPGYDPQAHGSGIVHLGLGAFHKAHQAVYTDDALAASGGDWRITGVSLRSATAAQELAPQDCRYAVLERSVDGTRARVIGALAAALALSRDRAAVLAALRAPATRIVSLTVTEKAYGIDRAGGGIDRAHPAIAADLADPRHPQGVAGLLVRALADRRAAGVPPFTVLCCDNLPENGRMLRALLVDFARATLPKLADHIACDVAFPSTMVDRITPARGAGTLALAQRMLGVHDAAAVETEAFRQWVVEDRFPTGRPAWQAGGAIFVDDVRPYEALKLRMLNGAHSLLAYAGFLAGHALVRDVMGDAALAALVARHMAAAAATLDPVPGVDPDTYADDLLKRFANPHLAHETWQIAMDGTEKLPQRIWAPACDALRAGQPLDSFAFATAAWMRYALGRADDGTSYELRDPREQALRQRLAGAASAGDIADRLLALPDLIPAPLAGDPGWRAAVVSRLSVMLTDGMAAAIAGEPR